MGLLKDLAVQHRRERARAVQCDEPDVHLDTGETLPEHGFGAAAAFAGQLVKFVDGLRKSS